MGASNFEDTAISTTMAGAYDAARRNAEWEYGHEAYNGTISTTAGVINLDAILAPFTPARRDVIAAAGIIAQPHDPDFDGPAVNHRGAWERWVEVNGQTWLMGKDVRPAEREAVARIAQVGIAKWGPCGGYEVTGKAATEVKQRHAANGRNVRGLRVFRFVGWAAE